MQISQPTDITDINKVKAFFERANKEIEEFKQRLADEGLPKLDHLGFPRD